jgi:hypothetical protein
MCYASVVCSCSSHVHSTTAPHAAHCAVCVNTTVDVDGSIAVHSGRTRKYVMRPAHVAKKPFCKNANLKALPSTSCSSPGLAVRCIAMPVTVVAAAVVKVAVRVSVLAVVVAAVAVAVIEG